MADYWVSQGRKYCDFCKCWITDNKPSVDFHEKGRRHQESVKKRLRNITRHSSQTQKASDHNDAALRQMEAAAMEAYKKDMESGVGDFSSGSLQQGSKITKLWKEEKTRDGTSYYVNFMTKERVWQPPREGYMSLKEQREQTDSEAYNQFKELEKFRKKEAMITMQKQQAEEAEESARKAREKMKERKVLDDTPPVTYAPLLEPGKTDPYGKWQTIKETVMPDLQLPVQETYEEYVYPEYEPEPPVKEFQEKTVESLGVGSGDTSFKKRKLNNASKRNARQRLDDD